MVLYKPGDRQKRRRLETKRWEFPSREMMLCRRYRGIKRSFHGKCARTIFMHELRCIKTTKEWPQQTSEVFDASQLMNLKSFVRIFHGIMFSFHTYWYLFTFQFNVTKVLHSEDHSMYKIKNLTTYFRPLGSLGPLYTALLDMTCNMLSLLTKYLQQAFAIQFLVALTFQSNNDLTHS